MPFTHSSAVMVMMSVGLLKVICVETSEGQRQRNLILQEVNYVDVRVFVGERLAQEIVEAFCR